MGTIYDTENTTFCGVLNQCIQYLQENTSAQIVVMSSTPAITSPSDSSIYYPPSTKYNNGTVTLFDINSAIQNVCRCNGVYYIPLGEGLGYGYARAKNGLIYRADNIHHTDLGGYNLAQGIWGYLKNIPLWYTSIPE